jgi:penicillin-insensitive murein endopeptidase
MPTHVGLLAGLFVAVLPVVGGAVAPVSPPAAIAADRHPGSKPDSPAALLELSDDELLARIEADPGTLGSLSIGVPGRSILFNAVALHEHAHWTIAPNAETWATSETIAAVQTAVETVHEVFPDAPPVTIGDISAHDGGRLKRHKSHQGGRDVDFGFYYKPNKGGWYAPGSAANLDAALNWTFVRALVTRTDVDTILLDTRIQKVLYKHALSIGEDREWLDRVFGFARGYRDAKVVHVAGHRTHYHVRFHNAVAQELGRRAHPLLVQLDIMSPPVYTVRHVVKSGQTIGHLAARYGKSVRAIQQANGLRTTQLRAGRAYHIPMRGAAPKTEPVVVPPRMLPPTTPEALAVIAWPTADSPLLSAER